MILIWDMGIGGVQKRVKDIIIDIGQNHPEWEVYLFIKRRKTSHFLKEVLSKTSINTHHFVFTGSYKRSKTIYAFIWIVKNYLKIKPHVTLTFLDHLSIIMVALKILFFWQKTRLVLNEGILTSRYININRKRPFLWKLLVKATYKYADKIIVPTRAIETDLINNFDVPQQKIKIIPNWTLFKPTHPLKPVYDLIYIGRFEKEKNPIGVIDIVRDLKRVKPNIQVCMLGKGRQESSLSKLILQNNLSKNVSLPGYQVNIIPYLRKSKIHILPTMNEGMPNVVLEAAMCQIPTVSSNFDGVCEVIKHKKTGYIAKSHNEMVSFIRKLLDDSRLRTDFGRESQNMTLGRFSSRNQKHFIRVLLA